jgi:3-oxoacyl-[acyl-carrier protein] reductase
MKNKIIAITGACGGIGQELVHLYIQKGAKIIGLDLDQKGLQQLQEQYPEHFSAYALDVTDSSARSAINNKILEEHGVPDLWFNNAGIADIMPFRESSQEKFDLVMDINFTSLSHFTRFWMEQMLTKGSGTIINVGSMAGYLPVGGMASYVASKHAVVGFTKSLQQEIEVEKLPIKLILVSPGFVETKIVQLGQKYGLPESMKPLLSTPSQCAKEIVHGVDKKQLEITPTLNGKLMRIGNNLSSGLMKQVGKKLLNDVLAKANKQ